MISRINFWKIIDAHFKTFRSLNQTSNKIYWKDFILFVLVPLTVSGILTFYEIQIKSQVTNLIAAISILGGFLFNLLAIIYNSMSNLEKDAKEDDIKELYIKEIHTNISYNILVGIFSIVLLILYNVIENINIVFCYLNKSLLFINYFFLFTFLLTLLMVLNRVYILLNKQH